AEGEIYTRRAAASICLLRHKTYRLNAGRIWIEIRSNGWQNQRIPAASGKQERNTSRDCGYSLRTRIMTTKSKKSAKSKIRQAQGLEQKAKWQAAEVARVDMSLRPKLPNRTQVETTLRAIVEGVEAEIGNRFFPLLVQRLATALRAQYAFVSE